MRPSGRWVLQAGALLLPDGLGGPGFVLIDDGRIAHVGAGMHPRPDLDWSDAALVPGFVDLQINGAAGCDFLSPTPEGLAAAHAHMVRSGVVAYLPTLISAPERTLRAALAFFAEHASRSRAPRILGVHLEGPFLSPALPGAHSPAYLRPPSIQWIDSLLADFRGLVRVITLAPELTGALDVIEHLVGNGIVVAVGHSAATFTEAMAAFDHGARLATHVFNAMRPFHHREPGVSGAALAHPRVTCSLIADIVHLHPATLRQVAALKGPERTALITDGISAAGAKGTHTLGDRVVTVKDGAPRLPNGTLAGSILTMDQAVDHMVGVGIDLGDAAMMASLTPARVLGTDGGVLAVGRSADLVALDPSRRVRATVVGGDLAYLSS